MVSPESNSPGFPHENLIFPSRVVFNFKLSFGKRIVGQHLNLLENAFALAGGSNGQKLAQRLFAVGRLIQSETLGFQFLM